MRNISQQERGALFTSKLIEGKDERTANSEIMRDINFLKDYAQNKRGKENIMKELDKEIAKRSKMLETIKIRIQKTQNESTKNLSCPDKSNGYINSRSANTKHLFRIIRYLEENKRANTSKLAQDICTSRDIVKDATIFLVKINLIKQSEENGVSYFERI